MYISAALTVAMALLTALLTNPQGYSEAEIGYAFRSLGMIIFTLVALFISIVASIVTLIYERNKKTAASLFAFVIAVVGIVGVTIYFYPLLVS